MKLEHASAYLPHGVKVYDIGTNKIFSTPLNLNTIEYLIENITSDSILKLALRPLSDLKKVDLDYLLNHHSTDWFADTDFENTIIKGLERKNLHNFIEFLPFGLVQWFIENHYDIFGLIESGQAIDINTLNK